MNSTASVLVPSMGWQVSRTGTSVLWKLVVNLDLFQRPKLDDPAVINALSGALAGGRDVELMLRCTL
jgi:hypothetical protein